MAEYVWVNVYPKGDLLGFSRWYQSYEAARFNSTNNCLSTDRYRVEERDGTRVFVYDPEPKYEERDFELAKGLWAICSQGTQKTWTEIAAERIAKHRKGGT